MGLQDVEVGGGTRLRVVVGVTRRYRRDPAGQIQLADHIDLALMQVDGAWMYLFKRPGRIHCPNQAVA